jgi:tRNA A37 threonylcarbamoyltransferase TsaD
MRAKLTQISNALRYEGVLPEEASRAFSSLIIEMEKIFPAVNTSGLAPTLKKLE